jgi:hypothetical protein
MTSTKTRGGGPCHDTDNSYNILCILYLPIQGKIDRLHPRSLHCLERLKLKFLTTVGGSPYHDADDIYNILCISLPPHTRKRLNAHIPGVYIASRYCKLRFSYQCRRQPPLFIFSHFRGVPYNLKLACTSHHRLELELEFRWIYSCT